MTQVDFYLLQQPAQEDRMAFTCRLCEKAMSQGMKIYIHTDSEKTAQDMDDLLWSFKPDSFIPHAIVGVDEDLDADEEIPVFIGFGTACDVSATLLINLSEEIPAFHDQFERIAEIVPNAEAAKSNLREHWNSYKQKGFELKHHAL
ncbi:DNA polymerase III subunit chi [Gammaproteobacteria bacterium]|nr:DNA polymerase III subunit chi [Gammaproteobacteria bacterium]